MYIETELEEVRLLINNHEWDKALGRIIELKAKRLVRFSDNDQALMNFYLVYALYFKRANEKFSGLSASENYFQINEMDKLCDLVIGRMPEFYKAWFLRGLILERKAYAMMDLKGCFAPIEITDIFNLSLSCLREARRLKNEHDELIDGKTKVAKAARAMFATLRKDYL